MHAVRVLLNLVQVSARAVLVNQVHDSTQYW